MNSNDGMAIAGSCLGILVLMLFMAIIGGFLVQVTLGYFGIDFTLWQGMVTAFTISWCFKSTTSTK